VTRSASSVTLARDVEVKLITNEALDAIRTRFYELVELSGSLDEEARDRLLARWERDVTKFSSALTGPSVTEWMSREDQVIVF
jgi:truncated hemoglobin YjbI